MNIFSKIIPTPQFLAPHVFGVECSDTTFRFMRLEEKKHFLLPKEYDELTIPEGCIVDGLVKDKQGFVNFLYTVKKIHNISYVRFALPSSVVYSFTVSIPKKTFNITKALEPLIAEHTPLQKNEAVMDYIIIPTDLVEVTLVQVAVVDKKIVQTFFDCFVAADMVPLQFEVDAQAIHRAITSIDNTETVMLIAMHARHTVIAIIQSGTVIFSTSIPWGGSHIVEDIAVGCTVASNEAYRLMYEVGFVQTKEYQQLFTALTTSTKKLEETTKKYCLDWAKQKVHAGIFPEITKVLLCGEYSLIPGLAEFIAMKLAIPTVQANPWQRCVSFGQEIPEMNKCEALRYATAIGLSLNDHL